MGSSIRRRGILGAMALWLALAGGARAQVPQVKLENPQIRHPTVELGRSVSVDSDTMIAGMPDTDFNGLNRSGVPRVWRSDGLGGWTSEAELIADDVTENDRFGYSVSISGDTAIIGIRSGSAYVFTRAGGDWTQQARLFAPDGQTTGDRFGGSVSISGNMIVVGSYWDNFGGGPSGSAYVFTRSGSVWTRQAKYVATDAAGEDHFGQSVSVDAGWTIIGAPSNDDPEIESGAAYVFDWASQNRAAATLWELYEPDSIGLPSR
jgi:hypothetical protein